MHRPGIFYIIATINLPDGSEVETGITATDLNTAWKDVQTHHPDVTSCVFVFTAPVKEDCDV